MPPKHLKGLNPEQEEAVLRTAGPLLVLAGAGTGKTRVVTCRIAEIVHKGTPPKAICAVTFTNKAAREMRTRVQEVLGRSLDGMVISTFHSLGLLILREFTPVASRPNVADPSDQLAILSDALRECGMSRKELNPRDALFRLSLWKNQGLEPEQALEHAEDDVETVLALAYRRYEQDLRRLKLVDFDDLILEPLRLLKRDPKVKAELQDRWRYFLVDEYQDTNGTQYQLIRQLADKSENLCVVGDDDQSIYSWRGADPRRILSFGRDFPKSHLVTLDRNYRSTGPILEAANSLIANNPERSEKVLRAMNGAGDPVSLYIAEDEKDELDYVASKMMFLRERASRRWEDFAVLFRANSQCRPLEGALRERQIPYRVVGTRSFFDRREIRDLCCFLRLAVNPGDDTALLRVINLPARGIGRRSVDRVIEWAAEARASLYQTFLDRLEDLGGKAAEGFREFHEHLERLRAEDGKRSAKDQLENLIQAVNYRGHLKMTVDDAIDLKRRLGALDELLETVQLIEKSHGHIAPLSEIVDALSLRDQQRDDKDTDGKGVTLMTLHAAKGLEFPVVFLVGLEEKILPHGKTVGDEFDDTETRGLEEERRLCYVGITRAREQLFLTRAARRRRYGHDSEPEPSRFLDEIGTGNLETVQAGSEEPATEASSQEWLDSIRSRFKKKG